MDALSSYRPISNLSFMSKIIEKLIASQLVAYLDGSGHLPKFQSGFRRGHSTETAIVRLLSDVHAAMDRREVTLLALLDVSAAFDTVDHDILRHRLDISFGIRGRALGWLWSFISNRSHAVVINRIESSWRGIHCGVPQGSVLGPLLYILYTRDVSGIVLSARLGVQQYADDTQSYIHCRAKEALQAVHLIHCSLEAIHKWMSSNRLKLNPDKTQFIWLGTRFQLGEIDYRSILQHYPSLVFQKTVVDLGVTLDQQLSMSDHVGRLCRSCSYQLRRLRTVRRTLSDKAAHMLVHAFVINRLDYCNAVLLGIAKSQTDRLQRIMNSSARLLLKLPRFSHVVEPMLSNLHWLPMVHRVLFKETILVWNCLNGRGPLYLQDLCTYVSSVPGRRHLRSADLNMMTVPHFKSAAAQKCGFSVAGPSAWNSLSDRLRLMLGRASDEQFKKELKTYLFRRILQ